MFVNVTGIGYFIHMSNETINRVKSHGKECRSSVSLATVGSEEHSTHVNVIQRADPGFVEEVKSRGWHCQT